MIYRDEQVKGFNSSHISSQELLGWGSPGFLKSRLNLRCEENEYQLIIKHQPNGKLTITDGINSTEACFDKSQLRIDGVLTDTIAHFRHNGIFYFASPDSSYEIYELNNSSVVNDTEGGGRVFAPMHGNLLNVFVENNQSLVKGERLAILEAMKMQHELIAENDGKTAVAAGITDDLTDIFSAVDMVKVAVAELGGKGGGGRADMAQGGAKSAKNADLAVAAVKKLLEG